MIELHSAPTPNSQKISIFLEEAAVPYRIIAYNMMNGEHLTPEYRTLNPNAKIPTIVDPEPVDGGAPLIVFESGAILLYLAEKTGLFLPANQRERAAVTQWLFWQVAGLGPMHGQANHFVRYAPDGQDYAIDRYGKEALRLLNVLQSRLLQAAYLAGDEYSIADMACWPWIDSAHLLDFDLTDFPAVERWWNTIGARPAVERVVGGRDSVPAAMIQKRMTLTPEQWSNVFGDRMHQAAATPLSPQA